MRIRTWVVGLIAIGAWAAGVAPAAAQTGTPIDVSVGYQFLKIFADDNIFSPAVNFPRGFATGVTVRLSPIAAIVGEATGGFSKQTTEGVAADNKIYTYAGGFRGIGDVSDSVSAFVQAMAGGVRLNGVNGWELQPGIGFEFRTGSRYSVRVQADYLYTRVPDLSDRTSGNAIIYNDFRTAASLVIALGGH